MAPTIKTALLLPEIGGPFQLSDSITLSSLNPDEALIEIHATGICHTDLSCASGALPGGAPGIYGHEGAGVVLETGADIKHVKSGDRVLLSFYHCGECEQCQDGYPSYCYGFPINFSGRRPDGGAAMKTDGKDVHGYFFGQSSFARHAIVHRSCIVKVPEDTNLKLFCPLGCGIQTGAGSVLNALNVSKGSSLAVFGVGSVGMSALMAGKLREAKTIIAIDLNEHRLELAKELGATHTILGNDEKLVEKVREIVKESGSKKNGLEFAVDCSGVPAIVGKMVDCLGTRGKAATVGAPSPGRRAEIEIFNHLVQGKQYVGCCEGDCVPSQFIPYLMEQQAAGKFPLEKIVSYYPMKDFEQAIKDTKDGKALKAVLTW